MNIDVEDDLFGDTVSRGLLRESLAGEESVGEIANSSGEDAALSCSMLSAEDLLFCWPLRSDFMIDVQVLMLGACMLCMARLSARKHQP